MELHAVVPLATINASFKSLFTCQIYRRTRQDLKKIKCSWETTCNNNPIILWQPRFKHMTTSPEARNQQFTWKKCALFRNGLSLQATPLINGNLHLHYIIVFGLFFPTKASSKAPNDCLAVVLNKYIIIIINRMAKNTKSSNHTCSNTQIAHSRQMMRP